MANEDSGEKPVVVVAKPTIIIQVFCVGALVVLSAIDAFSADFSVNTVVYAIIAGVLFGVGSIKQIFGGKE